MKKIVFTLIALVSQGSLFSSTERNNCQIFIESLMNDLTPHLNRNEQIEPVREFFSNYTNSLTLFNSFAEELDSTNACRYYLLLREYCLKTFESVKYYNFLQKPIESRKLVAAADESKAQLKSWIELASSSIKPGLNPSDELEKTEHLERTIHMCFYNAGIQVLK